MRPLMPVIVLMDAIRGMEDMADDLARCANPAADAILEQTCRAVDKLARRWESLAAERPSAETVQREAERLMETVYGPGPNEM